MLNEHRHIGACRGSFVRRRFNCTVAFTASMRSSALRVVDEAPPSSCILLADLTPEIVDERCETGVIRGNARQLLRVMQCGG